MPNKHMFPITDAHTGTTCTQRNPPSVPRGHPSWNSRTEAFLVFHFTERSWGVKWIIDKEWGRVIGGQVNASVPYNSVVHLRRTQECSPFCRREKDQIKTAWRALLKWIVLKIHPFTDTWKETAFPLSSIEQPLIPRQRVHLLKEVRKIAIIQAIIFKCACSSR